MACLSLCRVNSRFSYGVSLPVIPSHILDSLTAAGSPGVRVWLRRYRLGKTPPAVMYPKGTIWLTQKLSKFRPLPALSVCIFPLFPCFDLIHSNYKKYRQYREQTEKLAAQLQGVDGNKQA